MKKVNISICTTPKCYIEGARLLKQLDSVMSASLKEKTTRTGSGCHGFCEVCGTNAPCATVNNQTIFKATPGKILKAVANC